MPLRDERRRHLEHHALGNLFAGELPELAIGWRAQEFPDPRLLVLNEPLAKDLGLDLA